MDFVAYYQANTILIPFGITRNWNWNCWKLLVPSCVSQNVHISSLSWPMHRVVRYTFSLLKWLSVYHPVIASNLWTVLDRLGYKMAFKELSGSGIHRLENILTLNHNARIFFDTFNLWFEPIETVSNSTHLEFNWSFNWVSTRIYPTPTNFVRLVLIISTSAGSLL